MPKCPVLTFKPNAPTPREEVTYADAAFARRRRRVDRFLAFSL